MSVCFADTSSSAVETQTIICKEVGHLAAFHMGIYDTSQNLETVRLHREINIGWNTKLTTFHTHEMSVELKRLRNEELKEKTVLYDARTSPNYYEIK